MTPILAHISPFDVAAGARIDVRVASSLEAEAYGLNGLAWSAALIDRPQLSIEIMSIDLSGRVQVGRARFSIALANAGISPDRVLKWGGAPVKIYSAKNLAWPAPTEFDGEITDHSFDLDAGLLTITAEVSTSLIEKPLLTLEFDGSGGIGGEAEKRGTLKPAGFGACENIPPIWFDTVRNIGMIDGYGNTTAITRLMEGASDMGVSVGNYASYAALAAAIDSDAVPPGRWATCIAEGLVGLGAPPVGVIGVNATFGSNRLGAIMNRVLQTHAGVSAGDIDTASFTALDAALNYPAHYWTDNQIECKSLLESMARSCNSTLVITFQRKIAISRATASAPVATLDRSGAQIPRCIDWRILSPQRPTWRLKARAARPAQVLTLDQVNYVDTIIDRGLYNASTVYRAGNVVWLSDKSSWLYINATANSGNAPPTWPTTSNAYWQVLTPPATAASVSYADGTSLEALKPQEIGANVTEARTAAGIQYQAWAATNGSQSAVDNNYVGGFANQALDSEFTLGSTCWNEGYASGGSWPYNFFTALTSKRFIERSNGSALAGQQVNLGQTLDCGIPVVEGDRVECSAILSWANMDIVELYVGWFTLAGAYVGASLVANGNFDTRVGGFATVPSGLNIATAKVLVSMRVSVDGPASARMAQPFIRRCPANQAVLSPYNPGPLHERGANITETRVASAIAGQGPFAVTQLPVSRLTQIRPNLFPYPHGVDDGRSTASIGWSNTAPGSGFTNLLVGRTSWTDGGYYVHYRTSGGAVTLYPFYDMTWNDGGGYMISAGLNGYASSGTFQPYIEFINAAKTTVLGSATMTYNSASDRWEANGVWTPANTAFIRIVASAIFAATSTYQDVVFWSIKVERGPNATPCLETPSQRWSGDQVEWSTGGKLNSLRPDELGSNKTETRTAAAISGQTAWATYAGDSPSTYTLRVQYLDTSGQLAALDRVVDRRMTLLRRADGTTALTEAMAITSLGTAAAIFGQGLGALANNLAELDPTAASQLATAYAGGVMTVGYGETLKRRIGVGGTLDLTAQMSVAAGGSTSGNIKARIESSLFGANSWSTVSTGPGASVTPSEPGLDETSGTFTNSTGIEQMFEFRVVIVRTPGTAGGAIIASESFLTG